MLVEMRGLPSRNLLFYYCSDPVCLLGPKLLVAIIIMTINLVIIVLCRFSVIGDVIQEVQCHHDLIKIHAINER